MDMHDSVTRNLDNLSHLNDGAGVPHVDGRRRLLLERFAQASQIAMSLESDLEDFQCQKEGVENEIQTSISWLTQTRDELSRIDPATHSDEELVKQLLLAEVRI